jgi:hypothetical protein
MREQEPWHWAEGDIDPQWTSASVGYCWKATAQGERLQFPSKTYLEIREVNVLSWKEIFSASGAHTDWDTSTEARSKRM